MLVNPRSLAGQAVPLRPFSSSVPSGGLVLPDAIASPAPERGLRPLGAVPPWTVSDPLTSMRASEGGQAGSDVHFATVTGAHRGVEDHRCAVVEQRQRLLHREQRAPDVDAEGLVEVLLGDLLQRRERRGGNNDS